MGSDRDAAWAPGARNSRRLIWAGCSAVIAAWALSNYFSGAVTGPWTKESLSGDAVRTVIRLLAYPFVEWHTGLSEVLFDVVVLLGVASVAMERLSGAAFVRLYSLGAIMAGAGHMIGCGLIGASIPSAGPRATLLAMSSALLSWELAKPRPRRVQGDIAFLVCLCAALVGFGLLQSARLASFYSLGRTAALAASAMALVAGAAAGVLYASADMSWAALVQGKRSHE